MHRLSKLYIKLWLRKNFKSAVFRLPENAFPNQKIESRHSYACPLQAKLSSRFSSSPPRFNSNVNKLMWSIPTTLPPNNSCAK